MSKVDFHIHTTASDGTLSPRNVVRLAKENNINLISITDHNTTKGLHEAIKEGNNLKINVIPGIELTTIYNNEDIHLLGYFRDNSYQNNSFEKILKCLRDYKIINNKKINIKDGLNLLKSYNALVVLAHPILIKKNKPLDLIKNFEFDGIEAIYPKNSPNDTINFNDIAKSYKKLITAGSNFHSMATYNSSHGNLGCMTLSYKNTTKFIKNFNNHIY